MMFKHHQKIYFILMAMILMFCQAGQAAVPVRRVTLSTYYPSPQGIYDRIIFLPNDLDLTAPCPIGTIQADRTTSKLAYCRDDGTGTSTGVWGAFSSIWTQTLDNYVYNAASVGDGAIGLGIGLDTPTTRLHLDFDGGILAMGKFGQGQTIPNFVFPSLPAGRTTAYRLIWYPRRAIFRAIGIKEIPTATDEDFMSDYSVAFGLDNVVHRLSLDTTTVLKGSIIASGAKNNLRGDYSVLAGGLDKTVNANYAVALVNRENNAEYSTFTGNYATMATSWGSVYDDYTSIGSGWCNNVGGPPRLDGLTSIGATIIGANQTNRCVDPIPAAFTPAQYSVIGGGRFIRNFAHFSTIGGGKYSTTGSSAGPGFASYAVVGGGLNNVNIADHGTLTGGYDNGIRADYSVIAGGYSNSVSVNGNWGVVTGGSSNTIDNNYAAILGGANNTVSGQSSVIIGGKSNLLSGNYSVASGTNNNSGADYSWIGGVKISLTDTAHRSFVWGYSPGPTSFAQPDSFIVTSGKVYLGSSNPNAILNITRTTGDDYLAVTSSNAAPPGDILMIKANGFIGIGNNNPQFPLQIGNLVDGSNNPVGVLKPTGVFTSPSSRKYKEKIQPLDTQEAIKTAMELDPVTYNYKINKNEHHVGYIAEEVPDLVATKERRNVSPMDITAVLTAVVKDQKKQIQGREKVLDDIEAKLKDIESTVSSARSHKKP